MNGTNVVVENGNGLICRESYSIYDDSDGLRSTVAKAGRKSIKHMERVANEFRPDTKSTLFGRMVHTLLLEPDQFTREFIVPPEFHLDSANVTKTGKQSKSKNTDYVDKKMSEFARDNAGKTFVTRADVERAQRVVSTIRDHETASDWLDKCEFELSVYAKIQRVLCKARIDALRIGFADNAIVDLKTADNIEPRIFWRTFHQYGYAFSLAFYRELVAVVTGEFLDCYVIAAESDGDFDVCVYPVPEQLLDNNRDWLLEILGKWGTALASGQYPGVDGGEPYCPLFVPNWAMDDDVTD